MVIEITDISVETYVMFNKFVESIIIFSSEQLRDDISFSTRQ